VECKDQAEIDHFWNALSADPASEQCGWCKDKFGFSWQIVPDMAQWLGGPDTEASGRAMAAMMQMKKIDIAKMQNAYDGK
jgi:predicted 3-demethylubiquinone-9 3-methyltransferase (glyoxalase superfamily)